MFNYIKGKITDVTGTYIVLENNNIGYEINVSNPFQFQLENEYTVLNKIIAGLEDENTKKESIINVQKEFLETFANRIEKSTDKNELEKMIYAFRYYCLLPFSSQKYIKDVEELQEPLKKVMNLLESSF